MPFYPVPFSCPLEVLYQRNWYLVVSDETIGEFITSDYPVSLISLSELPPMNGVGFGMKQTEVSFPVSKYLALIGLFGYDVNPRNSKKHPFFQPLKQVEEFKKFQVHKTLVWKNGADIAPEYLHDRV